MGREEFRDLVVEEGEPGGAEALGVGGQIKFSAHDAGVELGGAIAAVTEAFQGAIRGRCRLSGLGLFRKVTFAALTSEGLDFVQLVNNVPYPNFNVPYPNFLVGRVFKDDEDLNRQALEWLEKANRRQLRELKASPIELFAAEKPHLVCLPLYVPEVYRMFQRVVDAYGCVSVERMKYPAPPAYIGTTVLVRESKDQVRLFDGHKELAAHKKKVEGSPAAQPAPNPMARRQRQAWLPEEQRLKEAGPTLPKYLDTLKAERGSRYVWSVKKLYRLLCQYDAQALERAVARAAEHRLFDVRRIETILLQDIAQREYRLPLESQASDYEDWPQYRQGAVTPEPDLKLYAPNQEKHNDKEKNDAP